MKVGKNVTGRKPRKPRTQIKIKARSASKAMQEVRKKHPGYVPQSAHPAEPFHKQPFIVRVKKRKRKN